MKFDFVIGNPPYQEQAIGDNKGFAPPVYDRFIESAQTISDCVEMIHPARFLFNAGRTPKVWNEKMLNDPHFKILEYYSDASKIFKDTDIMGGVSISYYNRRENYGAIKVFVPNHLLRGLLNKVIKNQDFESISQIMYVQNKFNLDKLYSKNPELKNVIGNDGVDRRIRKNAFEKITVFSENKISRSDIEIFGIVNNKRCSRFIASDYLDKGHENFNKYKVLVPSANGSPSIGSGSQTSVIGYPILLSPLCGYTQSFIGIGAFEHKEEAEAVYKYIKSKFARALLSVLKVTQDNPPDTWKYVPKQDFTAASDIDWKASIKNIDKQLYKKYTRECGQNLGLF